MAAGDAESATEAVAAVALGEATVGAVASVCLARVRERDPDIQAFRFVDETLVEERAAELDSGSAGPLRGLVVGVKDVIDTVDQPTGYGSPLFDGHRPARDADVVAVLRAAGALIFGKTESTEFAMFHPGRTRNPVDPGRTPGGSSSGSAAAVAAGMVPVALGTQTAGSVIRPAAFCGVYGFKPSRGWTSLRGVWPLAESLDTLGLFARSVADLELVYAALAGGGGGARRGRPPRVAVLGGEEWAAVRPEVDDALDAVVAALSGAGWSVREAAMPAAWRRLPRHQEVVMNVEVAANATVLLGDRLSEMSAAGRGIVERGTGVRAVDYLGALRARDEALRALAGLAGAVDLLLAPSALGVAPEGLAATGDPVMCRPWTLLGLPAANIPAYRRADGLPVGVQAVGTRFDDAEFLADLGRIEAVLGSAERGCPAGDEGASEE